jgi:hypothetical protein
MWSISSLPTVSLKMTAVSRHSHHAKSLARNSSRYSFGNNKLLLDLFDRFTRCWIQPADYNGTPQMARRSIKETCLGFSSISVGIRQLILLSLPDRLASHAGTLAGALRPDLNWPQTLPPQSMTMCSHPLS